MAYHATSVRGQRLCKGEIRRPPHGCHARDRAQGGPIPAPGRAYPHSYPASSVAWWRRGPRRSDAVLAGSRPKPGAGFLFRYHLRHAACVMRLPACPIPIQSQSMASRSSSSSTRCTTATARCAPHYAAFAQWLAETPPERIAQNRHAADLLFHRVGITFAVYGEASGTERLIPFDIVPHVIPGAEWEQLARGLRQRVQRAEPLPARHLPRPGDPQGRQDPRASRSTSNAQFRREMVGVDVPGGVYAHVAGVDLVRHSDGEYYVLEDNLRTPSGVSYMLENRKMMMRLFPELFAQQSIRPVDHYPDLLLETLRGVAPHGARQPRRSCCSRPGHYNSAYFEHAFLAQQMGIELVEGAGPLRRRTTPSSCAPRRARSGGRDLPAHRRRLPRPARLPPRLDAGRAGPARRPIAPGA